MTPRRCQVRRVLRGRRRYFWRFPFIFCRLAFDRVLSCPKQESDEKRDNYRPLSSERFLRKVPGELAHVCGRRSA